MNINYYTTPLLRRKGLPALEEQSVELPPASRVAWIGWTFLKLLVGYWRSKGAQGVTSETRAAEVRQFLEKMGGIWIKVGQVLAMRTDIFSLEFCRELSRLQDRAMTFSPKRSVQIVREELGRPLDEVFEDFEEVPFAAASLSQVHKARLLSTGEWVAVKVQRPHAREYFQYDIRWLKVFARVFGKFGALKHLRLDRMLQEIEEMMEEELDYRNEASNMQRLGKILERHQILVPKVYLRHSTERLLVMDYIDGVFMSDYIHVARKDPARAKAWLIENDIDTRRVARRLFQSVMRQLYEDLFFHADLHPGNIILLKGNRLAFIDFGNCGRVDQKFAAQYDQYFRAMSEHALEKAADLLLLTLGKLPQMDVDAFKKRVIKVLGKQISRSFIQNLPYREKSIGSSSAELNQIMAEYKIEVNWDMLKVARAFESVDQNLSVLNSEFNFTREMQRYQIRANMRKKQVQLRQIPNIIAQIADFAQIALPAVLQRSLNFGGNVGKGIQIVTAIISLLKKGLILAFLVAIWMYVEQYHHQLISTLEDEDKDFLVELGLKRLEDGVPKLAPEVWCFGAVVLLLVIWQVGKFTKKLLTPEGPLPVHKQ